jgi:hypothetical protein
MTYSTLLEETSKIVCLLLALLRLRMIVIQKQDSSINSSSNIIDISGLYKNRNNLRTIKDGNFRQNK